MFLTAPQAAVHSAAPGPKGLPLLGNLFDLRAGHAAFARLRERHGDIVRLQVGPMIIHVLGHPDHVRHVLVSNEANYAKGQGYRKIRLLIGNGLFVSEGQLWQRQRRLMQPPFTAKAVPAFIDVMIDSTRAMLRRWEELRAKQAPFEMNLEMVRITMSIVGRTMLGFDLAQDSRDVSRALLDVLDYVGKASVALIDIPLWLPTRRNARFKHSMATLHAVVDKILAHYAQHPEAEADNLLAKLMTARDPETGEGMSKAQLRDEIITIFLAGHETTALLLTWTWYLLSQSPEVERKFHQELDTVLGGRPPTAADLPNLTYTRMIVEETLRLYPPVWSFPRDAKGDDVIAGYHIPAGSMVLISPYLVHRHPDIWDDPERFDPERFSTERFQRQQRNAFIPFGAGPRTCIGNHFALLEAQVVLATIGQRFRPRPIPGQTIEPSSVATFRPRNGLMVTLERRSVDQ